MRRIFAGLVVGTAAIASGCGSSTTAASAPTGNTDFASATCLSTSCGGDPTGTWDLARACVEQPTDPAFVCNDTSAHGTVAGGYTFTTTSYKVALDVKLTECGRTETSGTYGGGKITITGNTITFVEDGTTATFCVQGDTLTLATPDLKSPQLAVVTLSRHGSASDAGTD